MNKKALIVVTSTEKYPKIDKATGLWLAQASHFYHELHEKGWKFDFISPKGGYTPIDPVSLQMAPDKTDWKYYADPTFRHFLANTMKPSEVKAEEYDVIYFTGGHGTVFDFPDNKELQELTKKIYERGGIVSGVCHGVTALLNVKLSNGQCLLKGKKVTGFSNEEEKEVKGDKDVPFLTETEMKHRGGIYSCASNWKEHVIIDDRLITGQNPASTAGVAKAILNLK